MDFEDRWEIAEVPHMVNQAEVKVEIILRHWLSCRSSRSQKRDFLSERLFRIKAGSPPSLHIAKKRNFCIHSFAVILWSRVSGSPWFQRAKIPSQNKTSHHSYHGYEMQGKTQHYKHKENAITVWLKNCLNRPTGFTGNSRESCNHREHCLCLVMI